MKRIAAPILAFAIIASGALASSSTSLKVSPSSPAPGNSVTASGTAPNSCKHAATIYSKGFSSKQKFSGTPSVSATLKHHKFSAKIKISSNANGSYKVTARCAGHPFDHVSINVIGFYP